MFHVTYKSAHFYSTTDWLNKLSPIQKRLVLGTIFKQFNLTARCFASQIPISFLV